jgi:hypothetical protein
MPISLLRRTSRRVGVRGGESSESRREGDRSIVISEFVLSRHD